MDLIETFCPANRQEWREWLQENHNKKQAVWLLHYKKQANKPSLSWGDAVDEALCFGWIDSVRKSVDADSYIQFFGKRKPKSGWSKINKEKVQRLVSEGLMMEAGHTTIETAKQNGSWEILDAVETLELPKDLAAALKKNRIANDYFLGLSKSVRKAMLQWVMLAKRPETREKRIVEIVGLAAQQLKPKQF